MCAIKKIQTIFCSSFIKSIHTSYFLIFYCVFDEPFWILLCFLSVQCELRKNVCFGVRACYALKITWISRGKWIRFRALYHITYDPIILMTSHWQRRPSFNGFYCELSKTCNIHSMRLGLRISCQKNSFRRMCTSWHRANWITLTLLCSQTNNHHPVLFG